MDNQNQQTYLVRTDNLTAKDHAIGKRVAVKVAHTTGEVEPVFETVLEYGTVLGGTQNVFKAFTHTPKRPWKKPSEVEIYQLCYAVLMDNGRTISVMSDELTFVYNTSICVSDNGLKAIKKSSPKVKKVVKK